MTRIYGRNETLKNFASGLAQDAMKNSLAEFIAPRVVTGVASGQYKVFSDKNSFLAPDASRAVGGKARRIGFESTDAYFNCAPNALEITIDVAVWGGRQCKKGPANRTPVLKRLRHLALL